MRIEADEVTYDETTRLLTADGHVKFTRMEEHLEADHVSLDVETKAGDFTKVSGNVGPGFYITAQQAHRTEDGQYHLNNATVTTCEGARHDWKLARAGTGGAPN